MTINDVSEATSEEARFRKQAAQYIGPNKVLKDGYYRGGFETLWEVWDRIDMLWLSRGVLSVIFTYDDSFSIAVIQISERFENASKGSKEVPQERFADCFTELADYALMMRQNRSRHVLMNVNPWILDRYEIACLGLSGRQQLVVVKNKDPTIPRGATTYLDVGMVKRIEEDVQEVWIPRVPFTIEADNDVFRITHGPFGFLMLYESEETIRLKSGAHDLPPVRYARWKKLYLTSGGRLERLLMHELSHQFEDLQMGQRQLTLPNIDVIPRRREDIEFHEEWEELHTVFSSALTRCRHVHH